MSVTCISTQAATINTVYYACLEEVFGVSPDLSTQVREIINGICAHVQSTLEEGTLSIRCGYLH